VMRLVPDALVHAALGEYGLYFVYSLDLTTAAPVDDDRYTLRTVGRQDLACANDTGMRDQAWYDGDGAYGFGLYDGTELLAVQWFWYGVRYASRNFWPLNEREAKSVQLYTVPYARGRGLATLLKRRSALVMRDLGYVRLYSRIWHSHLSSIAVSERAGWRRIALVAELQPFGLGRPRRVILRRFTAT